MCSFTRKFWGAGEPLTSLRSVWKAGEKRSWCLVVFHFTCLSIPLSCSEKKQTIGKHSGFNYRDEWPLKGAEIVHQMSHPSTPSPSARCTRRLHVISMGTNSLFINSWRQSFIRLVCLFIDRSSLSANPPPPAAPATTRMLDRFKVKEFIDDGVCMPLFLYRIVLTWMLSSAWDGKKKKKTFWKPRKIWRKPESKTTFV